MCHTDHRSDFPQIYCCGLKCCKEDVERVLSVESVFHGIKIERPFFWQIDDKHKAAGATVKCIYLKYIGVIRNLFHGLTEKLKKAPNMKS